MRRQTLPDQSLFNTALVDMLKYNVYKFLSFNPFVCFILFIIQQFNKSCKLLFSGFFLKDVPVHRPFIVRHIHFS